MSKDFEELDLIALLHKWSLAGWNCFKQFISIFWIGSKGPPIIYLVTLLMLVLYWYLRPRTKLIFMKSIVWQGKKFSPDTIKNAWSYSTIIILTWRLSEIIVFEHRWQEIAKGEKKVSTVHSREVFQTFHLRTLMRMR